MAALALTLDVSSATVELSVGSASAVDSAEFASAVDANGMSVFTEFSVGPMTAAFSLRMKIQKLAEDIFDSGDSLSLLMAPIRGPTFSWERRPLGAGGNL